MDPQQTQQSEPRTDWGHVVTQVAAIAGIVVLTSLGQLPSEVGLPAILAIYGVPAMAKRRPRKATPSLPLEVKP